MTTVSDFEEYTAVFGSVLVDAVPFADVEYDVRWTRSTVTHSRASKFSKIAIPGSMTVKTTIKKALVHSEAAMVLGYSLNDTPVTGTAMALLATSHVLDAADWYEDMTTPVITTPSRVRYTLQTNNVTVAGTVTLIGENAAGTAISEIIVVPATMVVGETLTSTKLFKKLYGHTLRAIDSTTDTGTFKVDAIAGAASYTVGNPKIFDIVGAVTKLGKSITITQPDCWFTEGGLGFVDAETIIEVSTSVEMHDPDLLTCVVVG